MTMKVRKNSKVRVWCIIASNGADLGQYSFYREEVKAYFPNCTIKGDKVLLI